MVAKMRDKSKVKVYGCQPDSPDSEILESEEMKLFDVMNRVMNENSPVDKGG